MTVESRVSLQSEKDTSFPNNTTGQITAAILRAFFADVLDSFFNLISDTTDNISEGENNIFWKTRFTFLYTKISGDNSANLQSVLDDLEALAKAEGGFSNQGQVKYTCSIGSQKVRLDSGITFNPTWVKLVGTGGQFDCSNMGANETAVFIDGDDDPQRNGQIAMAGISIDGGFGNQSILGRVGLKIQGAEFGVSGVRIRDFAIGETFGDQTFLIKHHIVFINRCGTAIQFPLGLTTTGEGLNYSQCKIADCDVALDINSSNILTMSFSQTHFDYNGKFKVGGTVGLVNLPGTASCSGTTVTGVGTDFTDRFAVGDRIYFNGGAERTIAAVTSDTVMTVDSALTQSAATYRKTGVFNIFKMNTTGNFVVVNFTDCYFEGWDYADTPFHLTGNSNINLVNPRWLANLSPQGPLACSSIFNLVTSGQSNAKITGGLWQNTKIDATAASDVFCEGLGNCQILNTEFRGQVPTWLSRTSGSPNFDQSLDELLLKGSIRIGINSALTPTGRPRIETQSQSGQTSDIVQHFVNAVKLAWITNTGKIFGFGLDAQSQKITNVANATTTTDALPKGQADGLYQPFALPNNTYSSDQTLTTANYFVQANAGVSNFTFYSATGNGGRVLVIRNIAGGNINLNPQAGQTIGGANPLVLANGAVRSFYSNGTNWVIFGAA